MANVNVRLTVCTIWIGILGLVAQGARAEENSASPKEAAPAGNPPVEVPYTGGKHPPNAKPGEVWCIVTIPAQFKTVCEQVCVKPPSCTFECVPARYETRTEKVCV